jgi:hypothetical protein
VAIIGSPAASHGVTTRAKAIDATATSRRNVFSSLGQTRPRKTAGTAASSPHEAGLPSAFAPRAPNSVKRFQNTKTPMPVTQKPTRIASTPRGACERATPVDSSMVT